ncbi:hypothetical protein Bhyg_02392, partial [Pseudolycoriella hygida]
MDNFDGMESAVDNILRENKFGSRRYELRSHDKEKTEVQPLNVSSGARGGRISKRNSAAIKIQRFSRLAPFTNGNKVDGDARKIQEHLNVSGAVTEMENETEMDAAVQKMMLYLMESGKRDENENVIDVATRKMMEILNEYLRISCDRDMLHKGKNVGKCVGSFNT